MQAKAEMHSMNNFCCKIKKKKTIKEIRIQGHASTQILPHVLLPK